MNDIAKCQDGSCPKRDSCLRWVMAAGDRQVYGDFKWKGGCLDRLPTRKPPPRGGLSEGERLYGVGEDFNG